VSDPISGPVRPTPLPGGASPGIPGGAPHGIACDTCILTPTMALFCRVSDECPKGYPKAKGDTISVHQGLDR
jgi:hypothetical protein